MTSRAGPTDARDRASEGDDRLDARALLERAAEVLKRNAAVRVESSTTHGHSRAARDRFEQLRHRLMADPQFRLAALNLMEDAAQARRSLEDEAVQRARAEADARESAERYRQLIDSMTEGFAVLEIVRLADGAIDARIVECNPAFAGLWNTDDGHGRMLGDLASEGGADWMRQLERVRRTGEPATFEIQRPATDTWLNLSVTRSAGAGVQRLALVVSDITWRKRAEAAVRESETRLRLIIENAREYAIFSMDPDRRVASWNSGAQAILGWSEQEVMGRSADLIFTPGDRAAGVPEREAAHAIAHDRASDERWHLRKDGSRFFASGVMTAMRDESGAVVGLLKIFRDQTAELLVKQAIEESRLKLQQALEDTERARADAEAATRAKDHFLAVLSHELRTPLTPVLLVTEMLESRRDLPDDVVEALAMIRRNVELEARFVDDLLDVTRIARGRLELELAPLDLHETIGRALGFVRPNVDAKRQRVAVDLAATQPRVVGDPARLQQVFWNLLKNASKFTPAGGAIDLRTRNDGQSIVVDIVDEGIGIDAARLAAIFDPFVQADDTIARTFGGLGLGLAIARAAVHAHGGTLDAQSAGLGRGATFTVRLPLSSSDVP